MTEDRTNSCDEFVIGVLLQTVLGPLLHIKSTDWQNYWHAKSAHPYLFKESIAYSQALTIKRICSTFAKKKRKKNRKIS